MTLHAWHLVMSGLNRAMSDKHRHSFRTGRREALRKAQAAAPQSLSVNHFFGLHFGFLSASGDIHFHLPRQVVTTAMQVLNPLHAKPVYIPLTFSHILTLHQPLL